MLKHKNRVSLIHDGCKYLKTIHSILISEGFDVSLIEDNSDVLHSISKQSPDIIIMVFKTPKEIICKQIYKAFDVHIIVITSDCDEQFEINALNSGADSYLSKPVRPHIFIAHVNALLRRNTEITKDIDSTIIYLQDLVIDQKARSLFRGGRKISLSRTEFDLLNILAKSQGRLVDRDSLYNQLCGTSYDGLVRSIDLHISLLRKKLGDTSPPYHYIKTIRGKGYILIE